MGQILTKKNDSNSSESVPLTNLPSLPFKLTIARSLENRYNFSKMKQKSIKDFHDFIENTIGKNLNISQVDSLYLRTKVMSKGKITQKIDGISREILHYGKDRHPFRVFGFYQSDHFVITKIDCKHESHGG